jgi:hypothetical protein
MMRHTSRIWAMVLLGGGAALVLILAGVLMSCGSRPRADDARAGVTHRDEAVNPVWHAGCGMGLPPGVVAPGPPERALPPVYSRYAEVVRTVGRLMVRRSTVPVWLPGSLGRYLAGRIRYLDVQYGTGRGYCLALGVGPPLPANSTRYAVGNAEFIAVIQGFPAALPYHPHPVPYVPLTPPPSLGPWHRVTIRPGILGFMAGNATTGPWIRWQEDGWTLNVIGAPGVSGVLGEAQAVAESVASERLPAPHGMAAMAVGTDAPSEVTYTRDHARYVLMANGWRALAWASRMQRVR